MNNQINYARRYEPDVYLPQKVEVVKFGREKTDLLDVTCPICQTAIRLVPGESRHYEITQCMCEIAWVKTKDNKIIGIRPHCHEVDFLKYTKRLRTDIVKTNYTFSELRRQINLAYKANRRQKHHVSQSRIHNRIANYSFIEFFFGSIVVFFLWLEQRYGASIIETALRIVEFITTIEGDDSFYE